ncbi:adenylate cyclase domain-containing protein [Cavenderia fasciculata]|uniref:Adenylate cyclase domain-containing protein n=1 Tax=Cavenderia fasciculata TaxID=261658 RepID=F4Q0R2_CACFS|nr:adenylate cyclase domain-containing protein [Cavenderia fasciculata]EGG18413.1 adenylate cyclase domain-containing protein [Cavenderia fasciculata]|eukprot:XP_004366317.1 adenylate cyclase domain-containing protein [Cavenderia fasciculata]
MNELEVELQERADQRWTMKPKQETLSFDKGFFLSVKAIQQLRKKNNGRVIVVGVAGPSGAGKTSLAHKIVSVLPKTVLISLDNYLDSSRQIIEENYDDYRLVDFELLRKNITDLTSNKATDLPLYDFTKSGRYAYNNVQPPESKVVLIEGIYALHEDVRDLLDLRISISGGVHFDLIKRIFRDVHRTGQQPHESLQQITDTVYPMYKAFIEPDLQLAEIKIVNKFNPFSGLLNPIYILKSLKQVTVDQVVSVLQKQPTQHTARYYDIYLIPPGVVLSESSSYDWIRVRNSDGIYSIMFSEEIKESGFIISPRVDFVVGVNMLGGLMSLGYQMVAIIHRKSTIFKDGKIIISFDELEELGQTYIQIKGFDAASVQEAGTKLGLENQYIQKSYIELYNEKYKKTAPLVHGQVAAQAPNNFSLAGFINPKFTSYQSQPITQVKKQTRCGSTFDATTTPSALLSSFNGSDSDSSSSSSSSLASLILAAVDGKKTTSVVASAASVAAAGFASLSSDAAVSSTSTSVTYLVREVKDLGDRGCKEALELYSQSFFTPCEPSERHISQLVQHHFYRVIVMEEESIAEDGTVSSIMVVACAFIIEIDEFRAYHLDYFCVHPSMRGNGVGGKFFHRLQDHLREDKIKRYQLVTLESETKMVGWYLKQNAIHLNVESDHLLEDGAELRTWWLLFVPLGTTAKGDSDQHSSMVITPSNNGDNDRVPTQSIVIDAQYLARHVKGVKHLLALASKYPTTMHKFMASGNVSSASSSDIGEDYSNDSDSSSISSGFETSYLEDIYSNYTDDDDDDGDDDDDNYDSHDNHHDNDMDNQEMFSFLVNT